MPQESQHLQERHDVEEAAVQTPASHLRSSIDRGHGLLASRQASDAIQVFADAYTMAVSAREQEVAALAMLGWAQAEFAVRRLSAAAKHARTALDLLTALGMPQAKHAADLVGQIDHNLYLQSD